MVCRFVARRCNYTSLVAGRPQVAWIRHLFGREARRCRIDFVASESGRRVPKCPDTSRAPTDDVQRGRGPTVGGVLAARSGPCERSTDPRARQGESTRQALRITVSKVTDAACPLSAPPFSHNNIRQRQVRESTRRGRRCPAPARLPTARPAVARAREACPASRREARSTRTGPQPVDTAEPEPSTRGTRRQRNQLHSSGLDFVAYGRAREVSPIAGRRRCLGGMGCPWRLHELPAAP